MAFSSRDFRLLWGGQTVSFVGDAAFIVALGWRVTDLTGKASSLGFVLALESLAMLVTLLWGGVLADRHSRRLLMIGSDLARGCVIATFFVLEVTGHVSLTAILVLATLLRSRRRLLPAGVPGHRAARRRAADASVGELVARRGAERRRDRRARYHGGALPHVRPVARLGDRRRLVRRLRGGTLARAPARVRARPGTRPAARARRGPALRARRAVDLDGDRRGDGDPDARDGAVRGAAAARRAGALPPRRRLVRRDLQRDGGRHGRRLARSGRNGTRLATA